MRAYSLLFVLFALSACSVNKAKDDNSLATYFESKGVDGCFTLFDNSDGQVTVYNMQLDTQRFSPASSFQVVQSLIALESAVAPNEQHVISWDKTERSNPDWNKDLTLSQAFRVNAVPHFQELARRIGQDTMQRWMDSLQYGTTRIQSAIDSFWFNNDVRVSPDEQLGLMKRLYFDQLPFSKRTQEMVRDMMLQEDNTQFKLSYKTGFGTDAQGLPIGWLVGWIEENRHPYFFVTFSRGKKADTDLSAMQLNITKEILAHLGFLKGEM
jgi:beta-lactamase class D